MLANYNLWAKCGPLPGFAKKVIDIDTPTYLYIVFGCFSTVMAVLSGLDRDGMA